MCRYEAIATDLTDNFGRRALFTRLGADATKALIVTKRLLIYLTEAQVGALAGDLAAEPAFQWWLIDIAGARRLTVMQRRWGRDLRSGNAPFQFAPAAGTEFFRPFGWREPEFRSAGGESLRLKRSMPMMRVWRFLSRLGPAKNREEFDRMSGNVLMARA